MNSVVRRTEEYHHTRLCENPNSKVHCNLDGLNHVNYKILAPVDLSKVNPSFAMSFESHRRVVLLLAKGRVSSTVSRT